MLSSFKHQHLHRYNVIYELILLCITLALERALFFISLASF